LIFKISRKQPAGQGELEKLVNKKTLGKGE